MYTIPYFDELGQHQDSPEFPDIQTMADYILQTPTRNHGPIFYNNHIVGFGIDDVIRNGKIRRSFTNWMSRYLSRS